MLFRLKFGSCILTTIRPKWAEIRREGTRLVAVRALLSSRLKWRDTKGRITMHQPDPTKTTFALYFGNRGMFPGHLMAAARQEVTDQISSLGFAHKILDEGATKFGAVETLAEGQVYAEFLRENHGAFDGVIVVLPNFGDENGAVAALKDAGVPILVLAYPDELNMMAPALRRDAFCGKFSVCDVLRQSAVPFTVYEPHTVHPNDPEFADNVTQFAAVCRVVRSMKDLRVGAIGARTTRLQDRALRRDRAPAPRHHRGVLRSVHRLRADGQLLRPRRRRVQEQARCPTGLHQLG
jgi:hypothetical protein